jgi:hypothetical protein
MKAEYYKKAENVLFFNPIERLLAKIFGADKMVIKCKTCGKIPTEVYEGYCLDHKPK